MSTYSELVYMVHDEMKRTSDDAYYTDRHIIFLLNKFRSFILKKEYNSGNKVVNPANIQQICLNVHKAPVLPDLPCELGYIVKSDEEVPAWIHIKEPIVYPVNFMQTNTNYVPFERFRYVGFGAFQGNTIYSTVGPDMHLYFKSNNPQFLYLKTAKICAVFDDPEAASLLDCSQSTLCDIMDMEFPLESGYTMMLIQLVVKELLQGSMTPADDLNTTSDNGPDVNGSVNADNRKTAQPTVSDPSTSKSTKTTPTYVNQYGNGTTD